MLVGLLNAPQLGTEDATRKARLITSVLRTMVAMGLLGLTASLFDSGNDVRVTVTFYLLVFAALFVLAVLVRRGRVILAGWIISLFFWLVIAFVTLFFGGLKGENAATFCVSVLLIGVVVGGRVAVTLAVASSAWCALVGWLEATDRLPPQLGPYSVVNAWAAVSVTLMLTSVLLREALDSLERLRARERAAATARDEALRRSVQAQKMELVGTLTAGIAHDFNNLLTVISGTSALLGEEADAEVTRELLDDLDAATTRATLMTRQLLAFGRAPASNERHLLELGELVRATAAMLPRLLGSPVKVELDVEPDCWVEATRAGVEQVVLNLAVNARDAMPHGGRLRLTVRGDGAEVVLAAADDGVGMDDATKARIFEPFFTTKASGTGLGLATVFDQVQRFDGKIAVESAPGRGTSFEFRFPRRPKDAEVAPEVTAEGGAHVHAPGRVLLVEDDALVRRSTARLLAQAGWEVVPVTDGDEALALLASAPAFDCVVTDCSMARLSGEALAETIATRWPALPVLLMSGARTPADEALRAPRRARLDEPLDLAQHLEVLRALTQ